MPKTITAKCKLNGHELNDVPVVNPGDWFGKTWLLEVGGSEKWGHHIVVDESDLGDYDPETCHYGPSGQVLDLDHLAIHGCEGCAVPFSCRYHGDGFPGEGVLPTEFCWDDFDEES